MRVKKEVAEDQIHDCVGLQRIIVFLILFAIGGCAFGSHPPREIVSSNQDERHVNVHIHELAGAWEYQEANVSYPLTLDLKGNGTYEWKGGRFHTTSLEDRTWTGTWQQEENDREGGFKLQLTRDLRTATGRWWYTRIEQDHEPLNPGGTFTLKRLPVEMTGN